MRRDEKSIQQYVKDKWQDNYTEAVTRWKDYYNNIAFYENHQWQPWDIKLLSYTQSPVEDEESGRIYATDNLIKPLADTRMSMILGERPMLEVVSNDKSADSINRSEKDTNILKALWMDLNVQTIFAQSIWWSVLTNRSFLRPYYDPEFGQQIKNPKYDEGIADFMNNTEQIYEEKEYLNLGRLNIDMFTPFNVIYDTTYPTWDQVRTYGWVLINSINTIDSLYSRFPKRIVDRITPDPKAAIGTYEEQLLMLRDYESYQSRLKDKKKSGKFRNVEVMEYYEAPNNEHPDGLHVIICQDELLYNSEDKDVKEKFKKIPVIRITDQIADKQSLVSGSRQKQVIYNSILSKVIEYTKFPTMYGLPGGLKSEAIEEKPYHIFNYDEDGATPVVIQPAPLPDSWLYLLSKIEASLEHHWGIHEVTSRSSTPGKSMSGRGIFLLQERDVSRLGVTMTLLSESLSDLGEMLLDLAKEHYRELRTLNYANGSGNIETITFSNADISERYKVSVEMTSEYKRNKQAYQQFLVQILGVVQNIPAVAQVLNDPVVMRKLISYFDDKMANDLVVHNQDMAIQEKENKELLNGGNPKVQPWHNHAVHIKVLTTGLLNSEEFMNLPEMEQQKIVQLHLIPHLSFIQKNMEMQQGMQQGIPPGQNPAREVFKQGGEATGPLEAIDQTVEGMVQPQAGNFGGEVVP